MACTLGMDKRKADIVSICGCTKQSILEQREEIVNFSQLEFKVSCNHFSNNFCPEFRLVLLSSAFAITESPGLTGIKTPSICIKRF